MMCTDGVQAEGMCVCVKPTVGVDPLQKSHVYVKRVCEAETSYAYDKERNQVRAKTKVN